MVLVRMDETPVEKSSVDHVRAARAGDEQAFRALVEPHRNELRAYCYRMAGSIDEADDLVQDSLLRAWRGLATFEERASVRTWLYRVTANVCIDRLRNRTARKRVEDASPAASPDGPMQPPTPDAWLGPCPPAVYATESPEARYRARESVSFAFLAALQLLPAKQRATLIARDVLGWSADECAEILDATPVSIESALRRARETIASRAPTWEARKPDDPSTREILTRYLDAWDRADARALVVLLHEDAVMTMPPLPLWLSGPPAIARSIDRMVFAACTPGTFRVIHAEANGLPALGVYKRDGARFVPYALHTLALDGDLVRGLTAFLDTRLFATFGLASAL
ncbi:MAG TPA: RNA polymerase subunit sigma-70 [Kofleriaceae bacterium]